MSNGRDKSTKLFIECGVAQTRAALVKGGNVEKLWFGPATGDEHLAGNPEKGHAYCGRILSINRALNAYFVDLGSDVHGFLPLNKKNQTARTEGALIRVSIKSPPRQGKGAILRVCDGAQSECDTIGRCPPFGNPILDAVEKLGEAVSEIVIDSGEAANQLKTMKPELSVTHYTELKSLFEVYDIAIVIDNLFERTVELNGGGRIVIDEAQAVTAIDVDTAGLTAASSERLREKIAMGAAREAMRQIKLRNIGGQIVIDFPKLKGDGARSRFVKFINDLTNQLDGVSSTGFSRSGLYSMVLPHHFPSVTERFTAMDTQNPIPGRSYTIEWLAQSAIRKLEYRLKAAPSAKMELRLGKSVFNYINSFDQWLFRLRERFGERFLLKNDEEIGMEIDFEISEQ